MATMMASDDGDDDDDKLPAWLADKTDDGKAAGDMILAPDRTSMGASPMTNAGSEHRGLDKSFQVGDQDVIDVSAHLDATAWQQQQMAKSLTRLVRLHKAVINGLVEMERRMQSLEAHNDVQARYTGTVAKAIGYLLEQGEAVIEAPVNGSRYARMEKSVQLAQRQIEADGGTIFKCTGQGSERNRELLAKAVQTGKITSEQMIYIKRTERLPAGISLN